LWVLQQELRGGSKLASRGVAILLNEIVANDERANDGREICRCLSERDIVMMALKIEIVQRS
jgi:hypothetical protein